jgi:hypothetical protein
MTKENGMLHRGLAAAMLVLVPASFVMADTHRGLLTELTDTQLTILTRIKGQRKGEKKVLPLAGKVLVVDTKDEKQFPLAELKKRVGRKGSRGLVVLVETNGKGQVEMIKADVGRRMPAKAAAILDRADQIELYSLEPDPDSNAAKAPKGARFRGWPVLGKVVAKDAKARKQILDILDEGVGRGRVAKCFDPRHGIRATHQGKAVDLVICFHCGQVNFYYDPKNDEYETVRISKEQQADLDTLLTAARVPLAKPANE